MSNDNKDNFHKGQEIFVVKVSVPGKIYSKYINSGIEYEMRTVIWSADASFLLDTPEDFNKIYLTDLGKQTGKQTVISGVSYYAGYLYSVIKPTEEDIRNLLSELEDLWRSERDFIKNGFDKVWIDAGVPF